MTKKQQAKRVQEVKKRKPSKVASGLVHLVSLLWRPRVIALFLVATVVVISYQKVKVTEIWPVESVKIEGEFQFLDKTLLRERVLPSVGGGLFTIDLAEVRSALIDLPWVEDVSVRRQWPDQLLIRVIEKQPAVYWGEASLLSAKGELFTPNTKLDIRLPKLTGPAGQHKMMLKEMSRMQAWLMSTGLTIESMVLDARRSWTLELTGDIEVRLGRKQTHERLHRFVSIYKSNLQAEKREIRHIDMRYTNGFAVAWKEA